MMDDRILLLYACCIPVKGAKRSIICDLQRKKYFFIPNSLYELLVNEQGKSIKELNIRYAGDTQTLQEYIKFLTDNDLGFLTNEPDAFPKIAMEWKSPAHITNAIIDTGRFSSHNYKEILVQLDALGCAVVQFRYFDTFNSIPFIDLMQETKTSRFRSFELLIPYEEKTGEILPTILSVNKRLSTIVIHGAPFEKHTYHSEQKVAVIYIKEKVDSEQHCGIIHPSHFRTDTSFFTEAQGHNSCLNRKIGVDTEGYIRNCPAARKNYGSVGTITLQEVLQNPEFKELWYIDKSQVKICRDCEFRYICTDCRVFTQENDPFGKPEKCNYDPYTATWMIQDDNPQSSSYKKLKTQFAGHENALI